MSTPPAARPSPTAALTRKPDREAKGRETLDQLLDDELVGTLCTVVDGEPWAVPMLFARHGDHILLHGSTGAGALRHVSAGAPAVFTVTALDGIVVAESTFESSANYRSAVIRGHLTTLAGVDEAEALEILSERLIPGRPAEVGRSTAKEVAATLALALPIVEGSYIVKMREGLPGEPEAPTDQWCGVIPLHTVAGEPITAPWSEGTPVAESVTRFIAARPTP